MWEMLTSNIIFQMIIGIVIIVEIVTILQTIRTIIVVIAIGTIVIMFMTEIIAIRIKTIIVLGFRQSCCPLMDSKSQHRTIT